MHLFLFFLTCFVLGHSRQATASGTEYYQEPVRAYQFNHDHGKWEALLRKIIISNTSGRKSIDFSILKKNRRLLDGYIEAVESVALTEFRDFSQNEQAAFLINSYNAFTLRDSLAGDASGPRTLGPNSKIVIFSDTYTVNEFIQKFIKRRISDPRAFLALMCFEAACPDPYSQALIADKVSVQIEENTSTFMLDKSKNSFDKAAKVLRVSSVLRKYETEFEKKYGGVAAFSGKYLISDQVLLWRAKAGALRVEYVPK